MKPGIRKSINIGFWRIDYCCSENGFQSQLYFKENNKTYSLQGTSKEYKNEVGVIKHFIDIINDIQNMQS